MTSQSNYEIPTTYSADNVKKMICRDCGKNFVHFVGGMPQTVCGVCDGVDSETGGE